MRKQSKPFVRYIRLGYNDEIPQGINEILSELGYDVYESPLDVHRPEGVFVSNVPLTEGWLYKNYQKFGLKLRGWVPDDKENELELRTW